LKQILPRAFAHHNHGMPPLLQSVFQRFLETFPA
jgi:hypothetical protein